MGSDSSSDSPQPKKGKKKKGKKNKKTKDKKKKTKPAKKTKASKLNVPDNKSSSNGTDESRKSAGSNALDMLANLKAMKAGNSNDNDSDSEPIKKKKIKETNVKTRESKSARRRWWTYKRSIWSLGFFGGFGGNEIRKKEYRLC